MTTTSAANRGQSTSPSVVVPAGAALNDVFTVTIVLNNSDVITAEPVGLVQREAFASGSAISARHYTMVVDGAGVSPGQTLLWTLSLSRQWNITMIGQSGISAVSHYVDSDVAYVAAATYTLPILPALASDSVINAHVHAKSNGTAITSFGTAPAGWTKVIDSISNTTFGFAGSAGAKDTVVASGSTAGGETWGSADQTPGSVIRFTTALKTSAGDGSVFATVATAAASAPAPSITSAISVTGGGPASASAYAIAPTVSGNVASGGYGTWVMTYGYTKGT